MINKKELSSLNNNLFIRVYKYKDKLIEVWWKKENGKVEFVYASSDGPMFPIGYLEPEVPDDNIKPTLDALIDRNIGVVNC